MSDKTTHSAADDDSVAQKGQAETNNTENQKLETVQDLDKEDTQNQSDVDGSGDEAESENDDGTVDEEESDSGDSSGSSAEESPEETTASNNINNDIAEAEIVTASEPKQHAEEDTTQTSDHCKYGEGCQRYDKIRNSAFQASIREQIENCKQELQESLKQSLREDFRLIAEKQIAKANRRRRWSNFFHDIVIVLLVVVAVYFGYCLYDVQYFPFMKSQCTDNASNCQTNTTTTTPNIEQSAGPVKDSTWYLANYSYLFENLRTNLNGDTLSAYYLYTNDYRAAEIKPELLLAMAYNSTNTALTGGLSTVTISGDAMRAAFEDTFGTLDYYEPVDFDYSCWHFAYSKNDDNFTATNQICDQPNQREIIEQIEKIYEEGEVIYVITEALAYDNKERQFYNFNNLFRPIALNVEKDDATQYQTSMNRYQYQFKKAGNAEKYYFSSITKLR